MFSIKYLGAAVKSRTHSAEYNSMNKNHTDKSPRDITSEKSSKPKDKFKKESNSVRVSRESEVAPTSDPLQKKPSSFTRQIQRNSRFRYETFSKRPSRNMRTRMFE
jgi:hypothetical protein